MITRPENWTIDQKRAALQYLLADRCSNYSYDWKDFRRISSQRSRARKAARRFLECPYDLHWDAIGTRLTITDRPNGSYTIQYVTGQSSNEEITNVLRRLVNPEARWVS